MTTISGGVFNTTSKVTTTTQLINGIKYTINTTTFSTTGFGNVAFTVTGDKGATCGNSGANGMFTCNVPVGWTGRITPNVTGKVASPAFMNFTKVPNALGNVIFQYK